MMCIVWMDDNEQTTRIARTYIHSHLHNNNYGTTHTNRRTCCFWIAKSGTVKWPLESKFTISWNNSRVIRIIVRPNKKSPKSARYSTIPAKILPSFVPKRTVNKKKWLYWKQRVVLLQLLLLVVVHLLLPAAVFHPVVEPSSPTRIRPSRGEATHRHTEYFILL